MFIRVHLAVLVSDATRPNRSRRGHACNETNASARIARRPLEQQVLIRLGCVDSLSYKEAAEAPDSPAETVMSRLARARTALDNVNHTEQADEGNCVRLPLRYGQSRAPKWP